MTANAVKRKRSVEIDSKQTSKSKTPRISVTRSSSDTSNTQVLPLPTNLLTLLDFTSLQTQDEISSRFREIAKSVIQDHRLVITHDGKEMEYEVLELEFYLIKPGCHEDPFTHGSDEQKQSGHWYFHRAPRRITTIQTSNRAPTAAGGYRGGTRKGLDLTLGKPVPKVASHFFTSEADEKYDPANEPCGGALLRSLRRLSDGKVISGPSLLVDEILRVSKAVNISELVTTKWNGNTSAFLPPSHDAASRTTTMFLRSIHNAAKSKSKHPRLFNSPRIGLDLSHSSIPIPPNNEISSLKPTLTHPRFMFVSKPYRYFIHPELLTANGRGQTFLGVYQACLAETGLAEDSQDMKRIVRRLVDLVGITEGKVVKYLEDYRIAKEKAQLKPFVGSTGKGVSAAPSSFLSLMGTLESLAEQSR
ncbi:unnamed protein product [Somion occarium]|uniref:Uncharacterized protein n=1 Tax=Somion occarium TaxID=3059160 RepID=A0ABP1CZN5_9APHY